MESHLAQDHSYPYTGPLQIKKLVHSKIYRKYFPELGKKKKKQSANLKGKLLPSKTGKKLSTKTQKTVEFLDIIRKRKPFFSHS